MEKSINLLLKAKFENIRIKNSAFSLRAFSKKLNIHPAAMSEIIRGKRIVSTNLAKKILSNSLFDEDEFKFILNYISSKKKLTALSRRKTIQSTELDLEYLRSWLSLRS